MEIRRLISTVIAILTSVLIAVIAAYLMWCLYIPREVTVSYERPKTAPVLSPAQRPFPSPTPVSAPAPAGELLVADGVVLLGGNDSVIPVRKVVVGAFAIGATEVTNAQYQDFIKETERKAPTHWQDLQYLPGTAVEPVTMVTWDDAVAYCAWLSRKLNAEVRLPTEAEWEMAARGQSDLRYPWGNDWDDRAVTCSETSGEIRAVGSFPFGRSPVGAYDMAGNVWEWVADDVLDDGGNPILKDGVPLRIAKGGAANESRKFIGTRARTLLSADKPRSYLGFRYVVIRKKQNPQNTQLDPPAAQVSSLGNNQ